MSEIRTDKGQPGICFRGECACAGECRRKQGNSEPPPIPPAPLLPSQLCGVRAAPTRDQPGFFSDMEHAPCAGVEGVGFSDLSGRDITSKLHSFQQCGNTKQSRNQAAIRAGNEVRRCCLLCAGRGAGQCGRPGVGDLSRPCGTRCFGAELLECPKGCSIERS